MLFSFPSWKSFVTNYTCQMMLPEQLLWQQVYFFNFLSFGFKTAYFGLEFVYQAEKYFFGFVKLFICVKFTCLF